MTRISDRSPPRERRDLMRFGKIPALPSRATKLVMIAGMVLGLAKAAEPTLISAWADRPPVIDGRGDDATWQKASPSAVRFAWDREWLYILGQANDEVLNVSIRPSEKFEGRYVF